MFDININEDEAREMMQQAIDKRIEELAHEHYFIVMVKEYSQF